MILVEDAKQGLAEANKTYQGGGRIWHTLGTVNFS